MIDLRRIRKLVQAFKSPDHSFLFDSFLPVDVRSFHSSTVVVASPSTRPYSSPLIRFFNSFKRMSQMLSPAWESSVYGWRSKRASTKNSELSLFSDCNTSPPTTAESWTGESIKSNLGVGQMSEIFRIKNRLVTRRLQCCTLFIHYYRIPPGRH